MYIIQMLSAKETSVSRALLRLLFTLFFPFTFFPLLFIKLVEPPLENFIEEPYVHFGAV